MRSYIGHVLINNEIKEIPFETDGNPVKHLWGKFGMAVYIERIEGVESAEEDTDEKETEARRVAINNDDPGN